MLVNKNLNYVSGSSARKYDFLDDYSKKNNIGRVKKVQKKVVVNEKNKIKTIFVICCLFSMLMVVTYRYNVISENNLTLQNLRGELEVVQSNLAGAEINVEQSTDLTKIEAYAKQKLGMQKPGKNQIVYIDTSKDANILKETNVSFVDEIIENIKGFINN